MANINLDLEIRNKLDSVIERIEKARKLVSHHHIVKIVAITKYSDVNIINSLYNIGQRAFGENLVQDLEEKSNILINLPIEWHFIGTIQTNKINKLLALKPDLIQSIDSYETAEAISKRLKDGEKISALLQINGGREIQKSGVEPEIGIETYLKIGEQLKNINLKGVMTIGSHTDEVIEISKSFRDVRRIFEVVQKNGASICSMGMSGDFEIAIAEGSNMVRLGSVIVK
jgi:pyridoxal phosphate enzyme (YggS family)